HHHASRSPPLASDKRHDGDREIRFRSWRRDRRKDDIGDGLHAVEPQARLDIRWSRLEGNRRTRLAVHGRSNLYGPTCVAGIPEGELSVGLTDGDRLAWLDR